MPAPGSTYDYRSLREAAQWSQTAALLVARTDLCTVLQHQVVARLGGVEGLAAWRECHAGLDALLAAYLAVHPDKRPSNTSAIELALWSWDCLGASRVFT